MDIAALNIIRRIDILSNLLKAQTIHLFEETARNLMQLYDSEKNEVGVYNEAIEAVNNDNLTGATEALEGLRSYFLAKLFDKPCSQKWDELVPTNKGDVKFCVECRRNVFRVVNKQDYKKRKQLNQCVAISFPITEKFINSTGCEITFTGEIEFLGNPATIDDEQ